MSSLEFSQRREIYSNCRSSAYTSRFRFNSIYALKLDEIESFSALLLATFATFCHIMFLGFFRKWKFIHNHVSLDAFGWWYCNSLFDRVWASNTCGSILKSKKWDASKEVSLSNHVTYLLLKLMGFEKLRLTPISNMFVIYLCSFWSLHCMPDWYTKFLFPGTCLLFVIRQDETVKFSYCRTCSMW